MVFSGLTFLLIFLPLLLLLYFVRGSMRWRNGVLVVFSLIFYAWGEPIMVLLLAGTTLLHYFCARKIASTKRTGERKLWLALAVFGSLSALFWFKYAGFALGTVLGIPFTPPRLPIGISFYTFQILTYTIDVYRGRVKSQKRFFRLLLYVSCFPQLIAGPIVQYADVRKSLAKRETTTVDFGAGMQRFFVGLGKKVLIANICGKALEECAVGAQPYSFTGAWISGLLFTLQLYFDFSAYSDMAIGLGRVLGFTYRENFRYPYLSRSASEFWRRWHISLGEFFRDYVYIPLGGNRKGRLRTVLNLLIVWALTGLWHGAAWNFILWGLYWFVLQQIDKQFASVWKRFPKGLLWLGTFLLSLIGWVMFYHAEGLAGAGAHLGALFGIGASGLTDAKTLAVLARYALYLPIPLAASFPIVPAVRRFFAKRDRLAGFYAPLAAIAAVTIGIVSLLFLIGQSYNPFIYFRF